MLSTLLNSSNAVFNFVKLPSSKIRFATSCNSSSDKEIVPKCCAKFCFLASFSQILIYVANPAAPPIAAPTPKIATANGFVKTLARPPNAVAASLTFDAILKDTIVAPIPVNSDVIIFGCAMIHFAKSKNGLLNSFILPANSCSSLIVVGACLEILESAFPNIFEPFSIILLFERYFVKALTPSVPNCTVCLN